MSRVLNVNCVRGSLQRFGRALRVEPNTMLLRVLASHNAVFKPAFVMRVLRVRSIAQLVTPTAETNVPIVDVLSAKRDCSKKAVERNRACRRIEAAARTVFHDHASRDHLYVFKALRQALTIPWPALCQDVLDSLHATGTFVASPRPWQPCQPGEPSEITEESGLQLRPSRVTKWAVMSTDTPRREPVATVTKAARHRSKRSARALGAGPPAVPAQLIQAPPRRRIRR